MSFTSNLVAALQTRLAALSYYRLRIDGLPGPGLSGAVVRFKKAHGLLARDFIGPVTLGAMFSADAKPWVAPPAIDGEPPWLTEARSLIGLRETPGPGNNLAIMRWARDLDQWYPGDDVPWCGLFVAHCMAVGAPNEPQDFNRLGARAWRNYGVEVGVDVPPIGSVCVLWRTHPTRSVNGHVFIVTGHSRDAIRGIGGNQRDSVSETWFDRGRVLGCYMPDGHIWTPSPFAPTGQLSTNEA